jgi:hypothetical protein
MGSGDPRLIMAAFKDDNRMGELFVMEDGEAKNVRRFTRNELRCFFPDCPMPELKAVSRSHARDGFSHLSGGQKHTPESVNHEQGKIVVRDWLRSKYPPAKTDVEVPIDGTRTRVADVLTIGTHGGRIAFEIQYAALGFSEWQRRRADYAKQGIADVWLFGHSGAQFKRSRVAPGEHIQLNRIQLALARARQPVFWFNPELRRLAIAYTMANADMGRRLPILPRNDHALVRFIDLDDCDLTLTGLHAPFLEELAQNEEPVQQFETMWERLRQEKHERDCQERVNREAQRRAEGQRAQVARIQQQRSLDGKRAAQVRQLDEQRQHTASIIANNAIERRIRQVARGRLVYCPRCWYPLTTAEEAREGAHNNCAEPPSQT